MNYGLIVTHGKMGKAMKETLELIVGPVDCIEALSFGQCDGIDELQRSVRKFIEDRPDDRIFLFTDILGGSCANISLRFLEEERVYLFTGINLPVLIVFYTMRKSDPETLCEMLVPQGRDAIVDLKKWAEQRKKR